LQTSRRTFEENDRAAFGKAVLGCEQTHAFDFVTTEPNHRSDWHGDGPRISSKYRGSNCPIEVLVIVWADLSEEDLVEIAAPVTLSCLELEGAPRGNRVLRRFKGVLPDFVHMRVVHDDLSVARPDGPGKMAGRVIGFDLSRHGRRVYAVTIGG